MRFTPAVKYGGRENQLSRRETGCMSGHPCRAHHKLKWARKVQSVLMLLYSHLPRSESSKTICAANRRYSQTLRRHPNSARSTLFDRGWQQPLDHQTAQPAHRVKDAEGTAKPLVLDSVRWLGYSATYISNAAPYPTPSHPCSSSLECVSSGTIRRPKWILRQFKEETRRLSRAKSSLVTQEWHSAARNCVLRNF